MTLQFSKRLRRFSLACLIAIGSTLAGSNGPNLYANENTLVAKVNIGEWTESNTCNYQPADEVAFSNLSSESIGTHDSYPIYRRTASTFETSLAAIAATAFASTGVSVEQMIEPFAMAGSQIEEQSFSIVQLGHVQLDQWWSVAKDEAFHAYDLLIDQDQSTATAADAVASDVSANDDADFDDVSLVPLVDFDSEIEAGDLWATPLASAFTADPFENVDNSKITDPDWDDRDDDTFSVVGTFGSEPSTDGIKAEESIASEEQKSLQTFGPSVLAMIPDNVQSFVDTEHVASAPFVGTAGVIASIDEVYMPYDFAVRDLQAGSLFQLAKRPFCIRSRVELPELTSAWSHVAPRILDEDDYLVQTEVQEADTKLVDSEKADEQLEKLVWHTQLAIEKSSELRESLRPGALGRHIATFVVSSDAVVSEVATRLAWVWPAKAPLPPKPAGAQLLVDASAAASADAEVETDADQIAERVSDARR